MFGCRVSPNTPIACWHPGRLDPACLLTQQGWSTAGLSAGSSELSKRHYKILSSSLKQNNPGPNFNGGIKHTVNQCYWPYHVPSCSFHSFPSICAIRLIAIAKPHSCSRIGTCAFACCVSAVQRLGFVGWPSVLRLCQTNAAPSPASARMAAATTTALETISDVRQRSHCGPWLK